MRGVHESIITVSGITKGSQGGAAGPRRRRGGEQDGSSQDQYHDRSGEEREQEGEATAAGKETRHLQFRREPGRPAPWTRQKAGVDQLEDKPLAETMRTKAKSKKSGSRS